MLTFVTLMMNQSNNMMAMLMKQSEVSMTTLATIISAALGGNKGGEAGELIKALQASSNTTITSQAELFKALLSAKDATGNNISTMRELLELAKELKGNSSEGSDGAGAGDGIGETLQQVCDALSMAGKLTGETEGVQIPEELQVQ